MNRTTEDKEMRAEYNFSAVVQEKHHIAYQQGTNVILLEPDF